MAVLMPSMLCVAIIRQRGDAAAGRQTSAGQNRYTPCMQPMAANKNRMTNSTSSTVRDADQPVRQSRSAKSIETSPVSSTARGIKNEQPPAALERGRSAEMFGASASVLEPVNQRQWD